MKKFLLVLLCSIPFFSYSQPEKKKKIISQMLTACEQIRGSSFVVDAMERKKDGRVTKSEMLVKVQSRPTRIYVYSVYPNPGAEALWRAGIMNNHVLINPNGFPYVTLKLDVYNTMLRKESHHTIRELGFDYILAMVYHYQNELGEKFYSYLDIADTIQWDGKKLVRLVFDFTNFAYKPYTVGKGENVTTISLLNYLNDYMIVCANENVSGFHDVKTNQVIRIPNSYGRKVVFCVDLNTMLPLIQEIYDEKGLFERYELKSFLLNPNFDAAEFTPQFKDYHF